MGDTKLISTAIKRPRRLALAVAGLAAAGIVTIPVAGASAATNRPADIYKCNTYVEGDSAAEAYCSGTPTSAFRVGIECTGSQGIFYRYGPYVSAGGGALLCVVWDQ
jgi:hypothetical protein